MKFSFQNTVWIRQLSVSEQRWHNSVGAWLTGSFPPMACIQNLWSSSDRACTVSTVPGLEGRKTTLAVNIQRLSKWAHSLSPIPKPFIVELLFFFFFPTSVTRTQTAQLQINAPQLSPGGFRLRYPPEICGLKWLNLGFFFSINITENGPGRGGVHGEKQGFYYWRTQWAETNRHTNTYEGNPFYSGLQNPVAGNHVLIVFLFCFFNFHMRNGQKDQLH